MFLSIAVMAHPARARLVDAITPKLPGATINWDRGRGVWDTAARAWGCYAPASRWHLVVQDDAVLCSNFLRNATRALGAVEPVRPVSFYLGGPRPHADIVGPALKRARDAGAPWLEMEGPWWGPAYAVPTAMIPAMLSWCEGVTATERDERRVAWHFARKGIRCWYTVPSLVDHRDETEAPSLLHDAAPARRARWYVGHDDPPADWTQAPIVEPTSVRYP